MLKYIFWFIFTPFFTSASFAQTYYVRTDGGSGNVCDGTSDSAKSSDGHCAWDHPFEALGVGAGQRYPQRIAGGDTLIIKNGSYRMGYTEGKYDESECSTNWPWDCRTSPVPSGTKEQPTRILGEGWQTGCKEKTELYGVERAYAIFDISNNNIEIECFNLTDHDKCIRHHGHGGGGNGESFPCSEEFPFGDFADNGISAKKPSNNILLKDIEIHGFASTGILSKQGGENWTLKNLNIHHNGWAGWDGGEFKGEISINNTSFSFNGCAETYPDGTTIGCWSDTAGGYGDGLGLNQSSGKWQIQNSSFTHNTSDGLDLLHLDNNATVSIGNSFAEGNAGNQIKIHGVYNSIHDTILIGNCAYFDKQSFTYNVGNCRAMGHPLVIDLAPEGSADLTNLSLYSEGDGIFVIGGKCIGSENVIMRNIAAVGDTEFLAQDEKSAYLWNECNGVTIDHDFEYIYNLKNNQLTISLNHNTTATDNRGLNSYYKDPKFRLIRQDQEKFDLSLTSQSPARKNGLKPGSQVGKTIVHENDQKGIQRKNYDIGALEYKN